MLLHTVTTSKNGEISVILGENLFLFLPYSFKPESIFIMYGKVKSLTGQEKKCYNLETKVKVILIEDYLLQWKYRNKTDTVTEKKYLLSKQQTGFVTPVKNNK